MRTGEQQEEKGAARGEGEPHLSSRPLARPWRFFFWASFHSPSRCHYHHSLGWSVFASFWVGHGKRRKISAWKWIHGRLGWPFLPRQWNSWPERWDFKPGERKKRRKAKKKCTEQLGEFFPRALGEVWGRPNEGFKEEEEEGVTARGADSLSPIRMGSCWW